VPSWASPRTDPISQEVMFGGPDNIQPFHPESCLPAFMLQNS